MIKEADRVILRCRGFKAVVVRISHTYVCQSGGVERERELLAEAAGQFFISSVGLMTWAEATSLRASVRVVVVRMECIVSPE